MITIKTLNFKIELLKNGYSILSFAKNIGIDPSYLNQVVNKKRHPSAKMAKRIADALNTEVETIFTVMERKELTQ